MKLCVKQRLYKPPVNNNIAQRDYVKLADILPQIACVEPYRFIREKRTEFLG